MQSDSSILPDLLRSTSVPRGVETWRGALPVFLVRWLYRVVVHC